MGSVIRKARDIRRIWWILAGLSGASVLFLSCSESSPFDSSSYLRSQIAEQSGKRSAEEVSFPFELEGDVLEAVQAKLKPVGDAKSRAARVLDYIFRGLDLKYELAPTRDANGTFRERRGNCLSFVNLFVAAGRQIRINPFYVEVEDYQRWDHRQGMVVSQGHIVAGLYVDGELRTYDFLPYRVKSYRDFEPIDDLTATAHYFNNLGAEALLADEPILAKKHLETASAVDPTFVKASNNLGVWYARENELDRAIEIYRHALEIEPGDVPLLINLARAYQRKGMTEAATAALAKVEGVHHTNPFFFVYQGEAALAKGDHEQALIHMRDALRTETEAPEVHVGLTKVYVALGEMKKARHHLKRALALDAGHPEARKLLYMLNPMMKGSDSETGTDDQEPEGKP